VKKITTEEAKGLSKSHTAIHPRTLARGPYNLSIDLEDMLPATQRQAKAYRTNQRVCPGHGKRDSGIEASS